MAQPPLSTETTPTSIPNPSSSSSSSSSTPTSSPAPPISYAAQQNVNASGNSQQQQQQQQQQSHSGMNPNSAVNPPIPAQPPFHTHPPRPAAPSFSYNFPQSAPPAFTANQHRQSNTSMPDSATQDFSKVSSASSNLHPVPAPTSISAMPPCSDPNYRPTTLWMPTAPTFPVHPVMPGTPSTPGPPGFAKPVILPSNPAAPSTSTGFPSAAVPRQNMPTASDPNASHRGLPYPPIPSMVAPPQGYWLQPPQMSGVHRPPFHQYPAAFPGPFSFPARGGALPAVPVPDSQPPGVTPVGAASISAPAASSHLLRGTSGVQTEVISAHTDDKHKSNATVTQNEDAANDQLDAWTAHKTEAGIVYYYNALTGQSTYDKPAGFKGEAHQVAVQPTPVSMVDLPGTDWQLVSTSDGKKYYYNNRTKDPYHGPGQAMGLSFSVPEGVKVPSSLVNIFKELKHDLGCSIPSHGNLEKWAVQGVLLLNAVLTVRKHQANSHSKKGWEQFTDTVIKTISQKKEGVVFLLWGKSAQEKLRLIDATKHHILKAAHPSGLSANRGFFGCRHFSQTNKHLEQMGIGPMDWQL